VNIIWKAAAAAPKKRSLHPNESEEAMWEPRLQHRNLQRGPYSASGTVRIWNKFRLILNPKRISARDRRHTAVHEASHAVIGRVLTHPCGGATIVRDHVAGEAGHAIAADPWVCTYQWEMRGKVRGSGSAVWHSRIISFMAGAEGELLLLGATRGGDGDDRYQIDLMANELDLEPADWIRREARLRAITRALIRRHRTRVERVAEALLDQGTLGGEAIDSLAGRSVNDVKVNAPWLLEMATGYQQAPTRAVAPIG
jgi:hypothetical protein